MKTYRETMQELQFTPEEKREMTDRLMAAASRPRRRTMPSLRRTAGIGVAAALVLTVGVGAAGAAGVLKTAGEAFSDVFGGAPAQTEIIDRIGYPVGASATADGVTVTADAIIGDTYSYAVVYTISRDDGAPLAEELTPNVHGYLPLRFANGHTDVGHWGGMHGSSYFFDADPADNAVQYVEMQTADTPLESGVARSTFRDLMVYTDDDYAQAVPVAEGKWKLKFDFSFENGSVELPGGQTFMLNGMEAVLDSVSLSPLSFQVNYTVKSELQWDENRQSGRESEHEREQSGLYFHSLPITLTKKDGTTLDLTNSGGSIGPRDGVTVCQKSAIFDAILSLDEVESITVADITLPVTAE